MPKPALPLAANIAHDFRTPLTVIKEYASIVGDGLVGPLTAEQQEFLKVIQDRADDLAVLVDNMLDLSKAQSGRLGLWRREVSVAEVLKPLAATLEHKAQLRKASLEVAIAEGLPPVYADPEKVGRIVLNLFADAVKHGGDGCRLVLSAQASATPGEVAIGLCDNRPELAAEELEGLRRRIADARETVCRGKGGGVGLRSVCRLVEGHFGRVDCSLSPEGSAGCFFTLPLRTAAGLVPCWLRSSSRRGDGDAAVSLWSIQPSAALSRGAAGVVDEFLQNAFRHGDLIVCVAPQRWLLASRAAAEKLAAAVARAQRRWSRIAGKRPATAMPPLAFTHLGVYAAAEGQQIVRQFENEPCDSRMLAGI